MDRWAFVRLDHAAGGGGTRRQLEIKMGKTETFHGWWSSCRRTVSPCTGLDGGNRRTVRLGTADGQYGIATFCHGLGLTIWLQAKSCTIALAVLSIYAVDFAINAGLIVKPAYILDAC